MVGVAFDGQIEGMRFAGGGDEDEAGLAGAGEVGVDHPAFDGFLILNADGTVGRVLEIGGVGVVKL